MGAVTSTPAQRRNAVLRRSQRKSVHGVRAKTDKLIKDIKKFKGVDEDSAYVDLKARIESLERDLRLAGKNLHPQVRQIYNDTLKKTEDCHQLLVNKLHENVEKASVKKPEEVVEEKKEDSDDVVVQEEEQQAEERQLEESTNKRRTVELRLVQVEPIEASPQLHKRESILRMGVPVMPGAIVEDLYRRTHDLELGAEEKITQIRKKIEEVELEISQFVGKKNGRYYSKIRERLEGYANELKTLPAVDEAIAEQIKLCNNYVNSCISFLDEKAVEGPSDSEGSDREEVFEPGPPEGALNGTGIAYYGELSPKTMRATYI